MRIRLHIILLAYRLFNTGTTAPLESSSVPRRDNYPLSPNITTMIHSADGTDVSSSFRTLVYYQPATVTHASNLTDRRDLLTRRIDSCREAGAQFLGSACVHSSGDNISLWRYITHCRINPIPMYDLFNFEPGPQPEPRIFVERGSCEPQICVNSMPHESPGVRVATCVDPKKFLPSPRKPGAIDQAAEGEGSIGPQYLLREIGKQRAGVTFSRSDASEVIELDALEVDVGVQGGEGGGQLQQQSCKDCYGMRTKPAPEHADSMKIEATLMATAALTGVIWVTIFAG